MDTAQPWVIITVKYDPDGPSFWSNDEGWVDRTYQATIFEYEEIFKRNLPKNGAWIPLWIAELAFRGVMANG